MPALANFFGHFIEGRDGLFRRIFRLVNNGGDHERRAVVIEKIAGRIIDPAGCFDGDLPFEHEPAIDAARAPAVQRTIENSSGVPIRSSACRRAISDGHRRQWAEFLRHFAAAFFGLRRFAGINARRNRTGGNALEVALRQRERFSPARRRRESKARRCSARSRCGRNSSRHRDWLHPDH